MLDAHAHQVSFPGGRLDEGEEPAQAALRESLEEVGIRPGDVELIGRLSIVSTVVNPSPITPFVGLLKGGRPDLRPNPAEVERVFTVPLVELTDPDVFRKEVWFEDGVERCVYFFELVGDTVWGATARILYELLELVM
jgi:8-oxo-dGTP pyrophosphatase MutT (NUDIX family)